MPQKKTLSKRISAVNSKARDLLKATVVAFCIMWTGMAIFMVIAAIHASRRRWPPLADSATLLGDCATLLSQPDPIEEENWPPSVKSLRPVSVHIRDDLMVIMVSKKRNRWSVRLSGLSRWQKDCSFRVRRHVDQLCCSRLVQICSGTILIGHNAWIENPPCRQIRAGNPKHEARNMKQDRNSNDRERQTKPIPLAESPK